MIGKSEIWNALNVTAITSLLKSYSGTPGLVHGSKFPDKLNGVVTKAQDTTINFYPSGAFNNALDYGRYPFTVNCRARNYDLSRKLAEAVVTAINRVSYTDYYIVTELLETIKPFNETDNFNTPIQVILKTRG